MSVMNVVGMSQLDEVTLQLGLCVRCGGTCKMATTERAAIHPEAHLSEIEDCQSCGGTGRQPNPSLQPTE